MSRAFVKEDIEIPDRPSLRRSSSGLPPGALNLMTADGAERLRKKLAQSNGGAEEAARLREMLESATIVEPHSSVTEVVFGARVTLRTVGGKIETYRVVGVDEAALATGNVSWVSPLGKALLAARVGQSVRVDPGNQVLGTVVSVA